MRSEAESVDAVQSNHSTSAEIRVFMNEWIKFDPKSKQNQIQFDQLVARQFSTPKLTP